jgi:hypothetical protein
MLFLYQNKPCYYLFIFEENMDSYMNYDHVIKKFIKNKYIMLESYA